MDSKHLHLRTKTESSARPIPYSLPAAPIVARIKTDLQAFEEEPVFRGTVARNVPLPTLPCVATVRLKPECIEVSLGHELQAQKF